MSELTGGPPLFYVALRASPGEGGVARKKEPKTLQSKVLSPPVVGRRGLEPRTP